MADPQGPAPGRSGGEASAEAVAPMPPPPDEAARRSGHPSDPRTYHPASLRAVQPGDGRAGADSPRLSRDHAERVISRALELQDARGPSTGEGMTVADIEEVAAQIGVAPELVRRAVTDVRLATATESEPSLTERWLGPRHLADAAIVDTDEVTVRTATHEWMTQDEGMRVSGARGAAERWTKDKRLLVELKRGLSSPRSSGTLRDLRSVTITVESDLDQGGTILEVEADTTPIRQTATAIAAAGLLGGIAVGVANAALIPETAAISSDLAQFGVTFAGTAAAGMGTAVVVSRTWAARVRAALHESLDGITMGSTAPQLRPLRPPPTGWKQTVLRWLGND